MACTIEHAMLIRKALYRVVGEHRFATEAAKGIECPAYSDCTVLRPSYLHRPALHIRLNDRLGTFLGGDH